VLVVLARVVEVRTRQVHVHVDDRAARPGDDHADATETVTFVKARTPRAWTAYRGQSIAYPPAMVDTLYVSDARLAAPDPHGPVIGGKGIFEAAFADRLAAIGITVDWIRGLGRLSPLPRRGALGLERDAADPRGSLVGERTMSETRTRTTLPESSSRNAWTSFAARSSSRE
jgi:hypothetical protein